MKTKLETIREYLATENTAKEIRDNLEFDPENSTATIYNDEYLILTDEEADAAAKEEIINSLWAFNAGFILEHTRNYYEMTPREIDETAKALEEMQAKLCETGNYIISAMIDDPDEFIQDAIDSDGRGHFLSYYDGEETEINDYYIYRIN